MYDRIGEMKSVFRLFLSQKKNEKKIQDENEMAQQGAELQQNLLSNGSTATQASEESSAPEINPTSQVQLFSQMV